MKNLNILFCTILIMFFSCQGNKTTSNIHAKKDNPAKVETMSNNLPYTSDEVKKYYRSDITSSDPVINSKKLVEHYFSPEEIPLPLKENDFEIKPSAKDKYYDLETFNFPNQNKCQLIIYNTFGENDSKILNIQLNSFVKDRLVDKLLLDSRFTFETEYYRNFKINPGGTIEITKFSVDKLVVNEAGDIVGENENPVPKKQIVRYKINSEGKFIRL